MVKHAANDAAVSDAVDAEIKKVLRDQLGAEIVESHDPLYPDDPNVPNMTYTFQDAMAEILPVHMPEYFTQHVGQIARGAARALEEMKAAGSRRTSCCSPCRVKTSAAATTSPSSLKARRRSPMRLTFAASARRHRRTVSHTKWSSI